MKNEIHTQKNGVYITLFWLYIIVYNRLVFCISNVIMVPMLSIRQAQLHPWIRGEENDGEPPYVVPQGDYPSHHGDPVVPLKCAGELTRATENHHQ